MNEARISGLLNTSQAAGEAYENLGKLKTTGKKEQKNETYENMTALGGTLNQQHPQFPQTVTKIADSAAASTRMNQTSFINQSQPESQSRMIAPPVGSAASHLSMTQSQQQQEPGTTSSRQLPRLPQNLPTAFSQDIRKFTEGTSDSFL